MSSDLEIQGKRPAVFFDRDGVVNEPPKRDERYLRRWEDFRFQAGMIELLAAVKRRGYLTVLVTNQQGVAKGLMTVEALDAIHRSMQATLDASGAAFDAIQAATGLKGADPRRKPSPAMLLEAAEALGIDLARSWMVGDHDNDMRAGQAAGVRTIRFLGEKAVTVPADYQVESAPALGRLFDVML